MLHEEGLGFIIENNSKKIVLSGTMNVVVIITCTAHWLGRNSYLLQKYYLPTMTFVEPYYTPNFA